MTISDDANQNNTITYRVDGRTEYWDSSKSQTINGNHDLPLSTFAITVVGGAEPRTDYVAPALNSFSFSGTENLNELTVNEGEKFQVHYDASDENGINSARIVFRNETGLEIYGYDYDDDGINAVDDDYDDDYDDDDEDDEADPDQVAHVDEEGWFYATDCLIFCTLTTR